MPCRAHEVKKLIFGTVSWGVWINENSVGLGPEERILGRPGAWLMGIRLKMEFSIPKIRQVGTCIALPGSRGEKNSFSALFRGGLDKGLEV